MIFLLVKARPMYIVSANLAKDHVIAFVSGFWQQFPSISTDVGNDHPYKETLWNYTFSPCYILFPLSDNVFFRTYFLFLTMPILVWRNSISRLKTNDRTTTLFTMKIITLEQRVHFQILFWITGSLLLQLTVSNGEYLTCFVRNY